METEIIKAIISGVVGGVLTGIAAWTAIRIEIKYLRRDVDYLLFGTDRRSKSQ